MYGIIHCAGLKLLGLHEDVLYLKHGFDRHIVVISLACTGRE